MKIDLSKDELDTRLYNHDNGVNAAENLINNLRKGVNLEVIKEKHRLNTIESAKYLKSHLNEETTYESGNANITNLGFSDCSHILGPIIEKIIPKGK